MSDLIGKVCVPKSFEYDLVSGCSRYTHAICVSEDPFILVSEQADMVWFSVESKNYTFLCLAHPDVFNRAAKRLEY